ncbi:unnamed protein product [Coregonus sp. 'balchen']|nr:unnamed protein product [Coregonus sp. 'balchen']
MESFLHDLTPVVSVSPPPSGVVHPGDNVTLQCTNVTRAPGHVGWFKQVNDSEPLGIASMYSSESPVQLHNGFQPSHMEMFVSHRIIFLKITELDVADSGLYFCGMFDKYIIFTNATLLKFQVGITVGIFISPNHPKGHNHSEKYLTEHCEEDLTPVVSVSPPPSVVIHPGDNVTLQCTNVTGAPGHVGWFKQVNDSEPLCIASMYSSELPVQHYHGFQPSHMEMFVSHRIIFLKITELDVADSGLYFCGMFDKYVIFTNATVLKVHGHKDSEKDLTEHCEEVADPQMRILVLLSIIRTGVLLCCLTSFIIIYTTRK